MNCAVRTRVGTQRMRTASESMYLRWKRTLAWYDKSINSGFVEAVNNIQTIRRMAREFRNIDYFIAMVYSATTDWRSPSTEMVAVQVVKQALG